MNPEVHSKEDFEIQSLLAQREVPPSDTELFSLECIRAQGLLVLC